MIGLGKCIYEGGCGDAWTNMCVGSQFACHVIVESWAWAAQRFSQLEAMRERWTKGMGNIVDIGSILFTESLVHALSIRFNRLICVVTLALSMKHTCYSAVSKSNLHSPCMCGSSLSLCCYWFG